MVHLNVADDDPYDLKLIDREKVLEHIMGVIMVQQFSVKKGLKRFGKRGKEAVTKELTQLHDMKMWIPKNSIKLTKKQRAKALRSLMFLTEKQDG